MKKLFAFAVSTLLILTGCATGPEFGEVSSAIQNSQNMQSEESSVEPEPLPEDGLYIRDLELDEDDWGTYQDFYVPIFLEAEDIRLRLSNEDWPKTIQDLIVKDSDFAARVLEELFDEPLEKLREQSADYPLARFETIRKFNDGLVQYIESVSSLYRAGLVYSVRGEESKAGYLEAIDAALLNSMVFELWTNQIEYTLQWNAR